MADWATSAHGTSPARTAATVSGTPIAATAARTVAVSSAVNGPVRTSTVSRRSTHLSRTAWGGRDSTSPIVTHAPEWAATRSGSAASSSAVHTPVTRPVRDTDRTREGLPSVG